MRKKELTYDLLEKVFHQCRHLWITDKDYAILGFSSVKKCPLCKRTSMTSSTVDPPIVGSTKVKIVEDLSTTINYLKKMLRMYDCVASIRILSEKYHICTISAKEIKKKVISHDEELTVAIAKAMLKYVTGDEF